MDLHPTLEALGADDLADITLEELKDKVTHIQPGKLPRQKLLKFLMGWLHEQIKKDIQQKGLLADFVNLLLTGGELQQEPFKQSEVRAAYKDWQARNAAEFSANRRRFDMVESDMIQLFERIERGLDSVTQSPVIPDNTIDREPNTPWIVGGGKQKSGANEIPLGTRVVPEILPRTKAPRNNIHQKLIRINEENKNRRSIKALKNASPVEQTSNPAAAAVTMEEASPAKTYDTVAPDISPRTTGSYTNSPPASYVCKRCNESGHWIQLCPTNMDSRWDTPPPPDYRCSICKKWGVHFATLCPRNEKESSLNKIRKRHKARLQAQPRTPTRDNSDHRDRQRLTPPSRRRSRSPKGRSPRGGHDIYRPDDTPRTWSQNSGGRRQRSIDRNSSSPWAPRERMVREPTRSNTLSGERTSYRDRGVHTSGERQHSSMEFRKPKGVGGGRLSYENDVFMELDASSATLRKSALSKQNILNTYESEDEEMADASLVAMNTPKDTLDETERAMAEADKFLDRLAAELFSGESHTPSGTAALGPSKGVPTNNSAGRPDEKIIGRGEGGLVYLEPADPHVHKPKFGHTIMSVLKNSNNPIINNKANRETACDMMDQAYESTLP
ncbi:hypothetical protein F4776DRAFT_670167 [Hypoxylon sp. NC0597]|nr:hypothetical protein F4776DRAFT_670167 [Hypoxylon sp. NC0597]